MDKKTLLLLDSNSLINRAFYAIGPLSTKDGIMTNAVYGYLSMLAKTLNDLKPDYIAAVFDLKGPTFRHKMYEGYKANRKGMPDELASQLTVLKEILGSFKIKIVEMQGLEADDIIGTLSKTQGLKKIIISGDRDLFQLASEDTEIWYTKRGVTDIAVYNLETVCKEYGSPDSVVELKSIMGDKADNIPGINGIGETGAKKLLSEYKTLDNIYNNIDKIQGSVKQKLIDGKEQAYLSKKLATICCDAEINCKLDDLKIEKEFQKDAEKVLLKYELKSLIKRFPFKNEEGKKERTNVSDEEVKISTVNKTISAISELEEINLKLKDKKTAFLFKDNTVEFSDGKINYIVPMSNNLLEGLKFYEIVEALKDVLKGKNNVFFDYKSILKTFDGYETDCKCNFDCMIADFLVNQIPQGSFEKIASGYNLSNDAYSLFVLSEKLESILKDMKLDKIFYEVEMPLIKILYSMEKTGFKIDKNILNQFSIEFNEEILDLTEKIYLEAGQSFNINSPKQISEILFDKLGLKSGKKTKSGFSSDKEVLYKLYDKHKIIPLLLRYRQISKLQSTYIDGLRNVMSENGRVHTVFKQAFVSTGRLSSAEPNLQNIPVRNNEGAMLRKMFVASEGNMLVAADYSQIELRILAHMSGDEKMIEAYKQGKDIHTSTAAAVFGVSYEAVTDDMRRRAKAVNFGIIYGISDYGLSENLHISATSAKEFIEEYFKTYPKVKEYMDNNVKLAKEKEYAVSLFGRIRKIPDINSKVYTVRKFNERIAMNMPIQGTAADIIKMAMINVYKKIEEEKLSAKLILQVHDELIIDTPFSEVEKVKVLLKECMENAVKLKVPLTVSIGAGKNWLEAK